MASIKKSLVIGMGIGQLYKGVLKELGSTVYTVDRDPAKKADWLTVGGAIDSLVETGRPLQQIDTAHICTPNWTHEAIAQQIAPYAKIVFIEKPGLKSAERLEALQRMFPETRFMMVKNNMWRDNIKEMQQSAYASRAIHLNWLNFDRVPGPGTWFTTKDLAFGGVSRDLMPHLLSLVVALFPETYKELDVTGNGKEREWSLYDLVSTEYGTVNANGIYNVDDVAWLDFNMYKHDGIPERFIRLEADWRTVDADERNIVFDLGEEEVKYELGLCPEYAYKNMIQDCFDNLNTAVFWVNQYEIDLWIHRMVSEI
jgi:predicted dehydrogenase